MSLHDQKEFLKSIHPFDLLSESELQLALKEMDIAYYPKDTILISPSKAAEKFYFVIKGAVLEYNDKELIREYHQKDCFDEDSLLQDKTKHIYKVEEDLICYELSKRGFLTLFDSNKEFKNFFLLDLTQKLQLLRKKGSNEEISDFMTARVKDAYLHKPCLVKADTTLESAVKESIKAKSSSIIVQKGDEYGIITDSDLKKYLLFGLQHLKREVRCAANFPLITIDEDDFLFNALFLFTKYGIKRVGVTKNAKLTGVLEQIDLLSFFANQTHLAVVKTQNATSIEELKEASLDYINIVKALQRKSVKFRYISKLISQINTNIFKKLFELILPVELRDKCAFVVLGSEGREEQIVRTDQDNAFIIKDGLSEDKFYPYAKKITEALLEFGYPRCEGNVMVSNSYWCKHKEAYKKELERWIYEPDEESFINFSIFFDARFIAGDSSLIRDLKDEIFKNFDGKNDIYLSHFAKLTLLFDTPVGFFSSLFKKDRHIDIKKAAIFPIVQGIRTLSLKYKIKEISTIERIEKLYQKNILKKSQKDELIEAFEILSTIRMKSSIEKIDKKIKPNNIIDIDLLTKIERDMLKDCLQIVNNFKKFISQTFYLEKVL